MIVLHSSKRSCVDTLTDLISGIAIYISFYAVEKGVDTTVHSVDRFSTIQNICLQPKSKILRDDFDFDVYDLISFFCYRFENYLLLFGIISFYFSVERTG